MEEEMKNKNIIFIGILIVLIVVMMFVGEKEEIVNLNYVSKLINGVEVFTIENKDFVEAKKETNLVKIEVKDKGIMIAELYPEIAPITVANYKKLVSEKYYDGLIFHRVINNFMIQTGDPTGTGTGGSKDSIKGEFSENGVTNNLLHTRGILSMARQGANPDTDKTRNSASSQFFIVQTDYPSLDGKYAAFGKVIYGLDLIDDIASVTTDENDKPISDVVMSNIRFVESYEGSED